MNFFAKLPINPQQRKESIYSFYQHSELSLNHITSLDSEIDGSQYQLQKKQRAILIFKKIVRVVKIALMIKKMISDRITSSNILNKTQAEISKVKPNMRNYEQISILYELIKDTPYFQSKKDIALIRQYCKYMKVKKLNASDIIFMSGKYNLILIREKFYYSLLISRQFLTQFFYIKGTTKNPLNILWKGSVTVYKPKTVEIQKKFENKFQNFSVVDAQTKRKTVNLLQNISTIQKVIANFNKSIKRTSFEQNLGQDFRGYRNSIQTSQTAKQLNQPQVLSASKRPSQLKRDSFFKTTLQIENVKQNPEQLRKVPFLRKAILVVEEIQKDIDFNVYEESLFQNCEMLSHFYEPDQENNKFNHQFVQSIEQGKVVTDQIDYDNKFDPSAVRNMSAIVTQNNTYVFSVDYIIFKRINQKNTQIKLDKRKQQIINANGYTERQTMKVLEGLLLNSKIIRFKKNEAIYQQNETPNYFYYFIKGDLQRGKKRIQLLQIKEFTTFGDYNALTQTPYSHTALCLSYCKVVAIEIKLLRAKFKGREALKNEIAIKAFNLNSYIDSRIQTYSNKDREQTFKGDIIYQTPIKQDKYGKISFNEFTDILDQFGGEAIIQVPKIQTSNKYQQQEEDSSLEYQIDTSRSFKLINQEDNMKDYLVQSAKNQKQSNQYTVQLKNKTVRSLYYKDQDQNQHDLTQQDKLVQMSMDLGYKNTKKVSSLNQKIIKSRYSNTSPSKDLIVNPFYDKNSQSARQMINKLHLKRRFQNYTFKLEQNERTLNNSASSQSPIKAIRFLDSFKNDSERCIQDHSQTIRSIRSSMLMPKDQISSNKILNIHTQRKKDIVHTVTPREQRQFKDNLQLFNNQSRAKAQTFYQDNSNSNIQDTSTTDNKTSNAANILKLIEKPHQIELRNRIASLIQSKNSKDNFSQQIQSPQLRICQTQLSSRSIKGNNQDSTPQKNSIDQQLQRKTDQYQRNTLDFTSSYYINNNYKRNSDNEQNQSSFFDNTPKRESILKMQNDQSSFECSNKLIEQRGRIVLSLKKRRLLDLNSQLQINTSRSKYTEDENIAMNEENLSSIVRVRSLTKQDSLLEYNQIAECIISPKYSVKNNLFTDKDKDNYVK